MVKIENNAQDSIYRILLRPNRSTDWKTSLLFISVIAFTCLTIGIGFALAGATMILPFAGLEIIFVATCVYLVMKNTYKQEVITLIAEGHTNAQIADILHLSAHTVNTHRKNIMSKIGVKNTAQIVMYAVKSNLVCPNKFLFAGTN